MACNVCHKADIARCEGTESTRLLKRMSVEFECSVE
jgi:hypothetical protein